MKPEYGHVSVLLKETVDSLSLKPGDDVLDGTLGAGGHAAAILELTAPNGRYLGLDLDETALETAHKNLARFGSRVMLVRGSYRDAASLAAEANLGPFQAALLDLGYSSMEIDDPSRGFSFRVDGPLDMRYNREQEISAATIVNGWKENELESLFRRYGEERYSRGIARKIVARRAEKPIMGTLDLAEIITYSVPPSYRHGHIHPATRCFQALRIAVNDELETVKQALPEIFALLAPGGRFAVISFHSLEDRIVKQTFRDLIRDGQAVGLTKKPVIAGEEELNVNPRARSAKLRVITKN